MKKTIALSVFLIYGVASAETIVSGADPRNLAGLSFCIDPIQIRSGNGINDDSDRTFSNAQFKVLKSRLSAYRIPFTELCGDNTNRIWVNLTSTVLDNIKSYDVTLLVFKAAGKVGGFKGEVAFYTLSESGVTRNYSDAEFKNMVQQTFGSVIDNFAADYAKANP